MICVDTNVLIRVLVDDPGAPEQVHRARSAVGRAKRVFVSQPVQIESVWVLSRSYRFGKEALLEVLGEMQRNQAFELEHDEVFVEALAVFRSTSIDFSDAVILTIGRRRDVTVVSFDRKLARQDGASLVK
jgi:predicted nucleic-acid-binding protein